MSRFFTLLAPLAVVVLVLAACAGSPTPTATPHPTITPLPCPSGYEPYADGDLGFSACYPEGWQATTHRDPESEAVAVSFESPTQEAQPVPRRIVVQVVPVTTGASDEELLQSFAMELMNRRARTGTEVGPIQAIVVDGYTAAEDSLQGSSSAGGTTVSINGWMAGFPAYQKMWYISVNGPSESSQEIEGIYREFLSHFHLAPRP